MNKAKKHRTDKRRRSRMTVRAFCTCEHPYNCTFHCGMEESELYVTLESYVVVAEQNFAA